MCPSGYSFCTGGGAAEINNSGRGNFADLYDSTLATVSGNECVQTDTGGHLTKTGAPCGGREREFNRCASIRHWRRNSQRANRHSVTGLSQPDYRLTRQMDTIGRKHRCGDAGGKRIDRESITKCGTTALASGDLALLTVADATYDGTRFQLLNPEGTACAGGSPRSNKRQLDYWCSDGSW